MTAANFAIFTLNMVLFLRMKAIKVPFFPKKSNLFFFYKYFCCHFQHFPSLQTIVSAFCNTISHKKHSHLLYRFTDGQLREKEQKNHNWFTYFCLEYKGSLPKVIERRRKYENYVLKGDGKYFVMVSTSRSKIQIKNVKRGVWIRCYTSCKPFWWFGTESTLIMLLKGAD